MRFSIGARLITMSALLLIIPTVAVSVFSYQSARNGVHSQINSAATSSVNLVNTVINTYMTAKEQDIAVLKTEVNSGSKQAVKSFLDKYQAQHPGVETTFVGMASGEIITDSKTKIPKGFNSTTRPWYKDAMANKGHIIITAPYVSASTRKKSLLWQNLSMEIKLLANN